MKKYCIQWSLLERKNIMASLMKMKLILDPIIYLYVELILLNKGSPDWPKLLEIKLCGKVCLFQIQRQCMRLLKMFIAHIC